MTIEELLAGDDPRPADELLLALARTREPAEIVELAMALARLEEPRAVPALAAHVRHAVADVRLAVVLAVAPHGTSATALESLVRLSSDVDREVRVHATRALASLAGDSRDLRDALAARLIDADAEVRGEALLGLARRKDPRVLEPLRRELEGPEVIGLSVEAAAELGDPSLLPQLEALVTGGEGPLQGILADAIRVLRGAP